MKKLVTLGAAIAFGLTTTSCSTLDTSTSVTLDQEKINYVNRAARYSTGNIDVIWVNPPKKRVKKKD